MPASRLKKAVASRRRPEDEGEEEGSDAGIVEDDSLSEPSAISNGDDDADVEGSDVSLEDGDQPHPQSKGDDSTKHTPVAAAEAVTSNGHTAHAAFKPSADTEAMLNGLQTSTGEHETQEVHFDDLGRETEAAVAPTATNPEEPAVPKTAVEKGRQEHQEYVKQRDSNPAFVPNRGGFFLHDDRSVPAGPQAYRGTIRGRGRGAFNGVNNGRGDFPAGPTERQWAHDLHDTVTTNDVPKPAAAAPQTTGPQSVKAPTVRPAAPVAPNRSFSTTTVLGNVAVQIFLPGMTERVSVPNVVKKQHTLLPHHRPPLRRDKPVRISIPDQAPRYIFPSTERSFIFIPRAMRPNQAYVRGRGRGSFHGSRRTSMFGGSAYSPSVAMSRKSSQGGFMSRDGISSPNGHMLPGPPMLETDPGKPIVHMPGRNAAFNGYMSKPPFPMAPPHEIFARDNPSQMLPMHQPRPQKSVSVADIESPASFRFHPPQQQQEQPFHQQVPQVHNPTFNEEAMLLHAHSRQGSLPNVHAGTPLSHIPERAIFAQPFQPFPMVPTAGFMAAPYAAPMYYQPMSNTGVPAPMMMAPPFVPGMQPGPYMFAPPPPPPPPPLPPPADATQPGLVAHESNGMVYYYDPSQVPQNQPQPSAGPFSNGPGGVIGMGGMMTPPTQPYYYPPPSNGVYYMPR